MKNQTRFIIIFLASLLFLLVIIKILLATQDDSAINIVSPPLTPTATINNIDIKTNDTSIINQLTPTIVEMKGDPNFREKMDSEILSAYPLFNVISKADFNQLIWTMYYSGDHELTVALKQDTPEIRQEVLDWITDNGVDPKSHKIIWKSP